MLKKGRIMGINDRRVGTYVNCEKIPHLIKTFIKESERIS